MLCVNAGCERDPNTKSESNHNQSIEIKNHPKAERHQWTNLYLPLHNFIVQSINLSFINIREICCNLTFFSRVETIFITPAPFDGHRCGLDRIRNENEPWWCYGLQRRDPDPTRPYIMYQRKTPITTPNRRAHQNAMIMRQ